MIGAYDEHWRYWTQVFNDAEDFKLWALIVEYENAYIEFYTT